MRVSKIWVLYALTGALVIFVAVVLGRTMMAKRQAEQQFRTVVEAKADTDADTGAKPETEVHPPAPSPSAPLIAPVAPVILNKLFDEAAKAFAANNYPEALGKLKELLRLCGDQPKYPIEMLMFNVGLAHLLGDHPAEAEKAFAECAKKFPQGEYTSRCHLGLGKAAIAQGGKEKQDLAIEELKKAAADPEFLTEASLALARIYLDRKDRTKARETLRPLTGAEIRTPQQATNALEVVSLLAENFQLDDLRPYLDHLLTQPGVLKSMAWFSNQMVVTGDAMVAAKKWDSALAIFRAIPERAKILQTQAGSLATQREELAALKERGGDPMKAAEAIQKAEAALKMNEEGQAAIEGLKDFDAALLMRCGQCCYYLSRSQEAAKAFAAIRKDYPGAKDAQAAAFSEIVLYQSVSDKAKVRELAEAFMSKYPQAAEMDKVKEMKEGAER